VLRGCPGPRGALAIALNGTAGGISPENGLGISFGPVKDCGGGAAGLRLV
jgi:hypothetical protein